MTNLCYAVVAVVTTKWKGRGCWSYHSGVKPSGCKASDDNNLVLTRYHFGAPLSRNACSRFRMLPVLVTFSGLKKSLTRPRMGLPDVVARSPLVREGNGVAWTNISGIKAQRWSTNWAHGAEKSKGLVGALTTSHAQKVALFVQRKNWYSERRWCRSRK